MKIFRLKFILKKIFGDKYKNIRNLSTKYFNPFFLNFTKKIGSQSIVKKEKGFIIDSTIDNYSTLHLRPKKSENFDLLSTEIISKKVAIIIQGNIGENYYF